MKNFVLLTFSEKITAEQIIAAISSNELTFKDFTSPKDSVAQGFAEVAKGIPYLYDQENNLLAITWKVRKKNIPSSVIKERLQEEKERLFQLYQTKMTKKEEREFKEALVEELMPYAYPKTSVTSFYFDFNTHVIYASVSNSDNAVGILTALNQVLSDNSANAEMITLELALVTKDFPFASTIKNLLLNKYFSSDENMESDFKLIPTGTYVINGEGQIGNLNNSKITLKSISSESEELKQALGGSNTRFVSSIGLTNNEAEFIVSEDLTFTGVRFDNALPKYNSDEMSMEEYLKGNVIIEINTMAGIYNCVMNLLKTGHQKYATDS